MVIGIDISQIVHEGTGVAKYVRNLTHALISADKKNSFVLFGASLRKRDVFEQYYQQVHKMNRNVRLVTIPVPPTILEIVWNVLHIVPVEWLIGPVDVFWSSDWTQPPLSHAKGITTVHDVSFFHFPQTFDATIVAVHKRRLVHVLAECKAILCDSEATKNDLVKLLGADKSRLHVVYPGL